MNKKIIQLCKQPLTLLSFVLAVVGASSTQAQYSGYYGEGFYGTGSTEFNFFTDLSDFNSDSDFYGITVGRTFNDNIAAELSYIDFSDSQSVISDPSIATLDSTFSAQALAVTVVGNYRLSRYWNVFGKLGLNQWSLKAEAIDNSSFPAIGLSAKDRGTGFNYGLGILYRLTPRYSLKLEYQVYQLNPELFSDDVVIGGPTFALRFNY